MHTFTAEDENSILRAGEGSVITYGIPLILSKDKWSIHTGFYVNDLTRAFYFVTPDGTQFGSDNDSITGLSAFKVPLLVSRDFKLIDRVSITPHVGVSWLTNTQADTVETRAGTVDNLVDYTLTSVVDNKHKMMGELGISLNINPAGALILTGGVHYSYGLRNIESANIDYQIHSGEGYTGEGVLKSRGSALGFQVGLKIPLYRLHGGHLRDF